MAEVVVFVEQRDGQVKRSALEVVAQGRALTDRWNGTMEAVLIGTGLEAAARQVATYGPDRVIRLEHPLLETYSPEGYARALAPCADGARALMMSATAMGRDLGPRVAARLGAGLASDCVGWDLDGAGALQVVRPVYSGKARATVAFSGDGPAILSLRPNVFPPAAAAADAAAPVETGTVEIDESQLRARLVGREKDEGAEIDVTEADIVVSGGRAMGNPENFGIIRDLAAALGGTVGASRAAVDAGYIDHPHQVGQTGKVVSPKLYIACGISGAIQHLAGMSSSKVIVAINKDRGAPIFKLATYGLVGDLFQIVPLLTAQVRKLKSE